MLIAFPFSVDFPPFKPMLAFLSDKLSDTHLIIHMRRERC
jgi:hypothetical protein